MTSLIHNNSIIHKFMYLYIHICIALYKVYHCILMLCSPFCYRTIKGRIQDLSQQINTLAHTSESSGSSNQSMMNQLQETMQQEAEQLYKLNKTKWVIFWTAIIDSYTL